MSIIITQKAEENKQISERIKIFMKRFEVSSALKYPSALMSPLTDETVSFSV